ncbi:hypothetical protein WJX73_002204 [Symbiochloris irregularis]|uniref:Cleavage/polyadenylation specificity factor A subunit N-terminal domain-containing protein n=1 Tax=Symbiochloris irregularis TaxID=706552 RepID=A0AAW1PZV3_9CHLO
MTALAVEVLHQDSCVLSACTGRFTAPVLQLATGKPSRIEIWEADAESQLRLATTIPLNSVLQQVLTLPRAPEQGLDWLLLLTADDSCALLQCTQRQGADCHWDINTIKVEVPGETVARRIEQVACSCAVQRPSQKSCLVQWALAVYEGVIHVLRATLTAGSLESWTVRAFYTGARHPEATMLTLDMIDSVYSWDVVAVVLATDGPGGRKLDLHSYELAIQKSDTSEFMRGRLSAASGPWLLKNVHPTRNWSMHEWNAVGLSTASVLRHFPATGQSETLIFLGSKSCNSQLLQLTHTPGNSSEAGSPLLEVQQPTFIDNPGPIHAAVMLEDPAGCGEQRLLMGCGEAPCGSVRLGSLSVTLQPSIQGGPHIEGQPTLHSIQVSALALVPSRRRAQQDHTLLAVGLWEANEVQLISLAPNGQPSPTPLLSIPLGIGHARSIVSGPLGSNESSDDIIFVGTSEGSVVFTPLPHDESMRIDLSQEISEHPIRRVHAGLGGAMLHYVPARAGLAPAHVYAQADKGLILRERAGAGPLAPDAAAEGAPAASCSIDSIEAVRVHQADGVVAIAPVHTQDLPASMAWLDRSGALTFGSLTQEAQLQWVTQSLGDTADHIVHHRESGCCLCLARSASGACSLRLFQAATLQEVMSIQLGPGHKHTTMCLATLPCSSAKLQSSNQPAKQFAVIASYLEDSSSGLMRLQGLLTVFEICASAGREHAAGYNLIHHGTRSLPAVPHCLTTTQDPDDAYSGSPTGVQVLLVGCHDAVRMYSLYIDDASELSQRRMAEAIQRVALGEEASGNVRLRPRPGPQAVSRDDPGTTSRAGNAQASTAVDGPAGNAGLLSRAQGHRRCCVTSISAKMCTVIAGEFLTSLTAFILTALGNNQDIELVRVAADPGIAHVVSLHVCYQSLILAGLHPRGVQLLRRIPLKEEAALELWVAQQQARAAASLNPSSAPSTSQSGHAPPSGPEVTQMLVDTQSHALSTSMITQFCPLGLGVQIFPLSSSAPSEALERLFQSRIGAMRTGAVAVCSDGAVLQLYVLDQPADEKLVSFAEGVGAMVIDGADRGDSPVTVSSQQAGSGVSADPPAHQPDESANNSEVVGDSERNGHNANVGKVINLGAIRAKSLLGISSGQGAHAVHCRRALKAIHDLTQPRSNVE